MIFEQFNGVDLDRLVMCIQAVREAGLTIDQHAQAGINPNSGNVYIWSEDWVGCVYCTPGGAVRWNWSCGNCGEEWDFTTYADMESFVSQQGDGCQACIEEHTA